MDRSERNTKLFNYAAKKLQEIQLNSMNNLIINSQFIMSQQTHHRLHRIDLDQEREHGIEDPKRERENHLATTMDL